MQRIFKKLVCLVWALSVSRLCNAPCFFLRELCLVALSGFSSACVLSGSFFNLWAEHWNILHRHTTRAVIVPRHSSLTVGHSVNRSLYLRSHPFIKCTTEWNAPVTSTSRSSRVCGSHIYNAVQLWELQVREPLRVLWGYSAATSCTVAFVTGSSVYHCSTLKGTPTCSIHGGSA